MKNEDFLRALIHSKHKHIVLWFKNTFLHNKYYDLLLREGEEHEKGTIITPTKIFHFNQHVTGDIIYFVNWKGPLPDFKQSCTYCQRVYLN